MSIDNGFGQEVSGLWDTQRNDVHHEAMIVRQEVWEQLLDKHEDVYTGEATIDRELGQRLANAQHNNNESITDKEFDL